MPLLPWREWRARHRYPQCQSQPSAGLLRSKHPQKKDQLGGGFGVTISHDQGIPSQAGHLLVQDEVEVEAPIAGGAPLLWSPRLAPPGQHQGGGQQEAAPARPEGASLGRGHPWPRWLHQTRPPPPLQRLSRMPCKGWEDGGKEEGMDGGIDGWKDRVKGGRMDGGREG